jgi:hypothetical protein
MYLCLSEAPLGIAATPNLNWATLLGLNEVDPLCTGWRGAASKVDPHKSVAGVLSATSTSGSGGAAVPLNLYTHR